MQVRDSLRWIRGSCGPCEWLGARLARCGSDMMCVCAIPRAVLCACVCVMCVCDCVYAWVSDARGRGEDQKQEGYPNVTSEADPLCSKELAASQPMLSLLSCFCSLWFAAFVAGASVQGGCGTVLANFELVTLVIINKARTVLVHGAATRLYMSCLIVCL